MSIYNPDKLAYLISLRTGLEPAEIQCPREQSDMTPCVCRDGRNAAVDDGEIMNGLCVGCGASVSEMLAEEEKKHRRPTLTEATDNVAAWIKKQPDPDRIKFVDLMQAIYNAVQGLEVEDGEQGGETVETDDHSDG